jgi:hypothetical protein
MTARSASPGGPNGAEAQAALRPDTGERADAAFALTSALDVFSERGLRTLSDAALTALERLKERV